MVRQLGLMRHISWLLQGHQLASGMRPGVAASICDSMHGAHGSSAEWHAACRLIAPGLFRNWPQAVRWPSGWEANLHGSGRWRMGDSMYILLSRMTQRLNAALAKLIRVKILFITAPLFS